MEINGKSINLRLVEVDDAEFIYNLRKNSKKMQYLSSTDGTVSDQRQWVRDYKKREQDNQEYYFIIESKQKEPLGLVRMYGFIDKSFCWGSWLIKENAPTSTAIESALQIYEFAFYHLAFSQSHFEVQKGNDKVIAFHKRFGAKVLDQNDEEYFFIITKKKYENARKKYKRYL